jgi:hypothetical protein
MILEQTTADQQGKQLQQSENTTNRSKQQQTNKGSNYNNRKIQTIRANNNGPTREATTTFGTNKQSEHTTADQQGKQLQQLENTID